MDIDEAARILELPASFTLNDIDDAWAFMVQAFHPDKFPPGKHQEMAKERLLKINVARDLLKTSLPTDREYCIVGRLLSPTPHPRWTAAGDLLFN